MKPNNQLPTRTRLQTRIKVVDAVAMAIALIPLAAAGLYSAGASTAGHVNLVTTATASPPTPNPQTEPFGAPSAKADYSVPPPPGQSTLVPTVGTKTTQRLYSGHATDPNSGPLLALMAIALLAGPGGGVEPSSSEQRADAMTLTRGSVIPRDRECPDASAVRSTPSR